MHKEIWKDIEGYEGFYQISNLGRVKSLERVVVRNDGIRKRLPEKMRATPLTHYGYFNVTLYKNNQGKGKFIHRLKAIAFIPNPENKPCINHRDGIKTNNGYHEDGDDNLEWATYAENNQHAYDTGLKEGAMKGTVGKGNFTRKRVLQICDKTNNVIDDFDSMTEAQYATGVNFKNISATCRGKRIRAGGYKWKYANE